MGRGPGLRQLRTTDSGALPVRREDGSGTEDEITSRKDFFWYEWIDVPHEGIYVDRDGYATDWARAEYWRAVEKHGFYDNHSGSVIIADPKESLQQPGRALLACWVTLGTREQVTLLEVS